MVNFNLKLKTSSLNKEETLVYLNHIYVGFIDEQGHFMECYKCSITNEELEKLNQFIKGVTNG